MVLRPVELDATRHPWPRETDQSRLNDILPIEKIITVRLVLADVDPSTDFREHHDLDELILDDDCIPRAIFFRLSNPVVERQRINFSATPLVDPFLEEHRILIRRERLVRGKDNRLAPYNDGF